MKFKIKLGLASIAVALVVMALHTRHVVVAANGEESASRTMALTFDDLPYAFYNLNDSGGLPRAQRVTTSLLRSLAVHHAQVVAFVNEGKLGAGSDREARIALVQQWVDAGGVLGNHTFSHADFNMLTIEEFRDEILKGESVIRQLMQSRQPLHLYFRHPYTHTGDTTAKKEAIEQFLAMHGYQIGPHTVDSSDFIFNAGYVHVLNKEDLATATRIRAAYLDFVIRATEFAEHISPQVFGRDIPQTILLHANDINADSLDELLKRLEKRGYRFVTLDNVMNDPAYQAKDKFVTKFGPTWLWRWRQSLGLTVTFRDDPEPPDWVLELFNVSKD